MIIKHKKIKQAYLIGIKGVGMTMLAQFLANQGVKISGSDYSEVFITDQVLKRIAVKIFSPFSPDNINRQADLIIYSGAFNDKNNSELNFIKDNKKIFSHAKILSYAQALGEIFNQHQGLAVCGSHGKTTVSACLGYVLKELNYSPKVLVGSYVPQFKGNAYLGDSNLLIAEVDEYQNKLQYFKPQGVILNNIDFDHPDYFKSRKAYYQVFVDFVKKIPASGFLVANLDDPLVEKIIPLCRAKVFTYSFNHLKKPDLLVNNYYFKHNFTVFSLKKWGDFKITLNGKHNIANALAVLGTALALGQDLNDLKKPLAKFKGIARRSQLLGTFKGLPVYDDYAHHPTELKATFKAFKEKFADQRLVVLFHPHTFTRTKALFSDFSKSFDLVDLLGLLQIYSSARERSGGVSSQELIRAIKKQGRKKPVKYLADFDQALTWLKKSLKKNDVLLLVGAGDIWKIAKQLLKKT